jgi:hypothetical protein
MEVFLRKLPPHLTDQSLHTQLETYAQGLGIKDWSCHKPRAKPFGNITFLHLDDAHRFLHLYGGTTRGKGQPVSRLVILGSQVQCQPSRGVPDPFLLKSLKKSADDRNVVQAKKWVSHYPRPSPLIYTDLTSETRPDESNVVFRTQSLSCGYYDYDAEQLIYVPEITWPETAGAVAKFMRRTLLVDYATGGVNQQLEIPYRIVEALVVSTRHATLTLTLWESPRIFMRQDSAQDLDLITAMAALALHKLSSGKKSRLPGLIHTNSDHQKIIGQSVAYQISASPVAFEQLIRRLHSRDVLPIYYHDLPISPPFPRKSLACQNLIRCYHRVHFQYA